MGKKLNTKEFIKRSHIIHNNFYDYSLVKYETNKIKVKIICPIHGEFKQTPKSHLKGQKCKKCVIEKQKKRMTLSTEEFINKANKIHSFKYDYSLTKYTHNNNKIIIICPIHGEFEQVAHTHLRGYQCQRCSSNAMLTNEEFVKRSNKKHNNKYDYSLLKYNGYDNKVKIICSIHGEFEQRAGNHLNGAGCPRCNLSKGVLKIIKLLEEKKVKFVLEKTFKNCKSIQLLPFDFYLEDFNACIEFDGIQHFKPMFIWGGEKAFRKIQERDKIKTNFCIDNDINLLRIKYNENIEKKIENFLKAGRIRNY